MNILRTAGATGAAAIAITATVATFTVLGDSGTKTDPHADRVALRANAIAGAASFAGEYPQLVDLLPNARLQDGNTSTDSVVVGTISAVAPQAGYDELNLPNTPAVGKPGARVTAFDDPLADWRTLKVTIKVEETLAGSRTQLLDVSWSLLGSSRNGEDATAVGRALQALGRVVILSEAKPSGPEYLGIVRDVPGKEGCVLQVASDGTLSLPLAGGSAEGSRIVDLAAFLEGVETLDKLRTQAAKPDHPTT